MNILLAMPAEMVHLCMSLTEIGKLIFTTLCGQSPALEEATTAYSLARPSGGRLLAPSPSASLQVALRKICPGKAGVVAAKRKEEKKREGEQKKREERRRRGEEGGERRERERKIQTSRNNC